jgi:hypothetical protein
MNPYRSGRAWLPAAVLSALFAVTLIVLQLIYHFGYDDSTVPVTTDDSILEWLFVNNLGFWGPGAFDPDRAQIVIANLSAGVAIILVAFALTWFALRGMAPGSSAVPAFFSGWLAAMVAVPIGSVVGVLVRSVDQEGYPLAPAIGSAPYNASFGLKWGWIAALVATAVWMSVRPKPGVPGLGGPAFPPPSTTPAAPPEDQSETQPESPPTTGTYPQPPS